MELVRWPARSIWVWIVWILLSGLAVPTFGQEKEGQPSFILILDASGSMWGQIEGENKIVIARRALGGLVDDLAAAAETTEVALVAYGHRREGDCEDIETVVPLGPLDPASMKAAVASLQPKGKTPITASVDRALAMVEDSPQGATLILLSDGLETCGGDPCRAVRLAKERLAKERLAKEHGKQLVLHVVGFDISGQDTSQLQCMAQAGGGLFFNAENAEGLAEALEAAVALPVDAPVGRLAVLGMADDQLHDVAVQVTGSEGKVMATARTYTGAETNPSSIPLADGTYEVRVLGVGLEGEPEQRFSISIVDGNTVEKTVDFSTGTLSIGVQRNGSLSDAVFRVYVSGTRREVASGRTYVSASTNPAEVRLTAGTYEVEVGSVEIADRPWQKLGTVEIAAKAEVAVEHEFKSGTLKIGAVDSAERVDAVVRVVSAEGGKSIAQGRTYTDSKTNPKTFELEPGHYRIQVTSMGQGKRRQEFEAEVRVGETVELDADFGKDAP